MSEYIQEIMVRRFSVGSLVGMRGNSRDGYFIWDCPQCEWECGAGVEGVGDVLTCGRCRTEYLCIADPGPPEEHTLNWRVVAQHRGRMALPP